MIQLGPVALERSVMLVRALIHVIGSLVKILLLVVEILLLVVEVLLLIKVLLIKILLLLIVKVLLLHITTLKLLLISGLAMHLPWHVRLQHGTIQLVVTVRRIQMGHPWPLLVHLLLELAIVELLVASHVIRWRLRLIETLSTKVRRLTSRLLK